ncbi:hypothetical protein EMCRGX_G006718 [Ephydatia muelleri]
MLSRNRKKRCKQRAEYLQKREDILSQENKAKARERYKADPEKKKASVRDTYNANAVSKRVAKRQRYQEDVEENRAAKRQRYQEGVEENRAAKRQRYQEGVEENRAAKRQRYREGLEENRAAKRRIYRGNSATIKAARRSRYWKGTTTTTQSYSLFEPNSRTLAEYGVSLEKAILRDSELLSEVNNAFCNSHPLLAQKVVTRSARAAVSKISADALLAKAISVRRSQAGSLLKTIRKVNAKKLQESDILVGHRFHTAGAEPYLFDNSYTHTKQHGAIPVDLNGRIAHFSLEKNTKMAEEVGKEFFDDSEGEEEVEEAHASSFITTSAPASASLTTSSSAAPASASPTTSSSAAPTSASPTTSSSAAPANASPTTSSSASPASASPTTSSNASPTISSSAAPASASLTAAPTSASPTTMASSSAAPPPPPPPPSELPLTTDFADNCSSTELFSAIMTPFTFLSERTTSSSSPSHFKVESRSNTCPPQGNITVPIHAHHRGISPLQPDTACNVRYIDDGVVAGPVAAIARILAIIQESGLSLGLNINIAKCELFSSRDLSSFPEEMRRSNVPHFGILGAPIGDLVFCAKFVAQKQLEASKLLKELEAVGSINPQVALLLLRQYGSFCRLANRLRYKHQSPSRLPKQHPQTGLGTSGSWSDVIMMIT